MSAEANNKVLVVGTGTMGAGIAQVAAAAGDQVLLFDGKTGAAAASVDRIARSLERAEAKGYVTLAQRKDTLDHLLPVESLDAAGEVDIIVEAVKEDLKVKQSLFTEIERICLPSTALWTNTSMISISAISAPLKHRGRFCGTHFFNPVPRMRLVEVIAGTDTDPSTVEHALATVRRWGKTPVLAPDSPGFIVNRILDAIKREALDLLDQGVPPDQVDTAVRLGLNFPMGPLELMDLIGLDTTLDCLMNQATAMERSASFSEKLTGLVASGKTGRKAGQGFYSYEMPGKEE
jgi:3-hydroxybutyryl-CoA dehydrogenase